MATQVKIGDQAVTLRATLRSFRRIEDQTGKTISELSELGELEALGLLVWAFVCHVPELKDHSVEQVEGLVDVDQLEPLTSAVAEILEGLDVDMPGVAARPTPARPPRAARRAKPKAKSKAKSASQ